MSCSFENLYSNCLYPRPQKENQSPQPPAVGSAPLLSLFYLLAVSESLFVGDVLVSADFVLDCRNNCDHIYSGSSYHSHEGNILLTAVVVH